MGKRGAGSPLPSRVDIGALKKNWPIVVGVVTGVVYGCGYIKLLYFLRKLGIEVAPTEVYSVTSIIVSGISLLVSAAVIPLTVLSAGYHLSLIRPTRLPMHTLFPLALLSSFGTACLGTVIEITVS